ncbi:MAG: methyltransferase, partial [Bacteroidales bacterium]
ILYKVNYCARTAMSVLMEIAEFRIRSSDDLYQNGLKIEWEKYLDTEMTFSVVPVVHSPVFNHTGYAGLLLKDAIADRFSQKTGKRPSVGTANPDIVFNLHISNDQVTVSVDSSVIPLYKRGYRREQGLAPINEVLAAGIVLLSGWDRTIPLLDPMCGSGTIPVEAALIASGIPPGKFRSYFGFQRWMDYDEDLFIKIKEESEAGINKSDISISCSDIDKSAVLFTKNNIESAGLSDIISVEQQDFSNLKGTSNNGFIIMNPPYGERMKQTESENLYGMIGTTLKHNFPGYKAFLITSDKEALKKVGLKHRQKLTLYNGSLECVLVKYELYEGSKKNRG